MAMAADITIVIVNYGHGETRGRSYCLGLPLSGYLCALGLGARYWVPRTRGRGTDFRYPLFRVPAHPLRALGACARGSARGDKGVNKYHGLTALWCCPRKCFEK